jgi:hypothetical protein
MTVQALVETFPWVDIDAQWFLDFLVDRCLAIAYNTNMKQQKERKMEKTLTVAELIAHLQTLDQDLPVEMGMNLEYQCAVSRDMLEVHDYDGRRYLCITDTPGYGDDE